MIVVEIYGFENNERTHYIREFKDDDSWERDLMMRKLSGTWVGHKKIYNLSMREWAQMTPEQRMILTPEQLFDKDAFLGHKEPGKGWYDEPNKYLKQHKENPK